jgi:hypothetical protein
MELSGYATSVDDYVHPLYAAGVDMRMDAPPVADEMVAVAP